MGGSPRHRRRTVVALVIAAGVTAIGGYLISRPHTPLIATTGPLPFPSPTPMGPGPIVGYSAADDIATHQVVVFGGISNDDATWLWTGGRWAEAEPATVPPGRLGAAIAYDPALHLVLLFGGHGPPGTDLHDTWAWSGANWRELDNGTVGAPPSDASMAWDPVLNTMVLLASSAVSTSATWTWSGTRWTPLQSGIPAPVPAAALGFDPATRQLMAVVWGRSSTETWAFNGSAWRPIVSHTIPKTGAVVGLGWDPANRQFLLIGGGASIFGPGRLWAWDGTDWTQLPTVSGAAIQDGEMTSTDTSLLLVGAVDVGRGKPIPIDVWSWTGARWQPAA